ncbi:uncharacterized protein LOC116289326 [Actinia tenebrosa]|uniref:Uncharacterized protein LOC116289326 n=1 Tax=Actinia tenebrosa TaxID=6105 RepID=A0A6P8H972_ACTTE|nr:uncharacterized protein LOC116289326 [Actinia tenebrosa]
MEVNELFVSALNYERRARWKQAVKKYEEIMTLLRGSNNDDRIAANSLKMLMYECHLHCGVAYHHLDQTSEAIKHYVTAMRVISRKKINCCVGCITGKVLHLHVPALAKISICHIQQGEYETALKKVEEALVLDFKNPDLFCIRACIYYLLNNKKMAMKDVNFAIWLRTKHVCAWLLRGIFKEKEKEEDAQKDSNNTDLEMAFSLEASASAYTALKDLPSSVHTILNRYLPSLRVSHTITPNDIFNELAPEPQIASKSNKSSENSRHQRSPARQHRCKSRTKIVKEKENPTPKDESSIFKTSVARKLKFHEGSFLNTRTKSKLTLNLLADMELYRTKTRSVLPRDRSSEFQRSNYSHKKPFPSDGIRVQDLLDVKMHPEQRLLKDSALRTEKYLGASQIGRVTSYPLSNKGILSYPCHTFKAQLPRRHGEQERLYPRLWTQNQYPVRIPDIKGCRSTTDLEST